MLFILRLAAFCTAFCTISPRVLYLFTLRFAPHLAANSPKTGVNGDPFK